MFSSLLKLEPKDCELIVRCRNKPPWPTQNWTVVSWQSTVDYLVDDMIDYSCLPGSSFTPNISATDSKRVSRCGPDGNWTAITPPECEEIPAPTSSTTSHQPTTQEAITSTQPTTLHAAFPNGATSQSSTPLGTTSQARTPQVTMLQDTTQETIQQSTTPQGTSLPTTML
jgi:hypothetical protein